MSKFVEKEGERLGPITYPKLFWLFIAGSLVGVVFEGLWTLVWYGRWETHVVTVFAPLCVIYGFGMAGCYVGAVLLQGKNIFVKFLTFALIGSSVEFLCGFVLEYVLGMYAWDYSASRWNLMGYVTPGMTALWGGLGVAFGFVVPYVERLFKRISSKPWNVFCAALSVFLAFDVGTSAVCFVRWKERHEGVEPSNRFERFIDEKFDDEWMQKRFCEWHFIDEKGKTDG